MSGEIFVFATEIQKNLNILLDVSTDVAHRKQCFWGECFVRQHLVQLPTGLHGSSESSSGVSHQNILLIYSLITDRADTKTISLETKGKVSRGLLVKIKSSSFRR